MAVKSKRPTMLTQGEGLAYTIASIGRAALKYFRSGLLLPRGTSRIRPNGHNGSFNSELSPPPLPRPPRHIIAVRDRRQVLAYSEVIISALEEALNFDPIRGHNQPPPLLRLEDSVYLADIAHLLRELRLMNALLRQRVERKEEKTSEAVIKVAAHFDRFLKSYASTLGKSAAALTIASIAALLYQAGLGKDIIDSIWGHLKLPK